MLLCFHPGWAELFSEDLRCWTATNYRIVSVLSSGSIPDAGAVVSTVRLTGSKGECLSDELPWLALKCSQNMTSSATDREI